MNTLQVVQLPKIKIVLLRGRPAPTRLRQEEGHNPICEQVGNSCQERSGRLRPFLQCLRKSLETTGVVSGPQRILRSKFSQRLQHGQFDDFILWYFRW